MQKADMLANFEAQMAQYMQAAGERIRAAREAKFSTRAKAQDETGISEKQWYRWEKGVTEPTASNWEKIAEVLEVDVAILRADPPKMLDPESEHLVRLDRIEAMQLEILTSIATMRDERAAAEARIMTQLRSIGRKLGTESKGSRSHSNG